MDFFDTATGVDFFTDRLLADAGRVALFRCLFATGFEDFALLIKSPSVVTAERCHHFKPQTGISPWGRSPSRHYLERGTQQRSVQLGSRADLAQSSCEICARFHSNGACLVLPVLQAHDKQTRRRRYVVTGRKIRRWRRASQAVKRIAIGERPHMGGM
jgi:hypothetical protein